MTCSVYSNKLLSQEKNDPPAYLRLIYFFFSFSYAYVLQSFPVMAFKDRVSYIKYAGKSSELIDGYLSHGVVKLLANEPLWLLLNAGLAELFKPEVVVRIIIFLGAFASSYLILKSNPKNAGWLMLFLLSPQILLKFTLHLRQGLAIAVFLFGYFSKAGVRRYVIIVSSCFIHSSFFFLLPFLMLPYFFGKLKFAIDLRLFLIIGVSILLLLVLGFVASSLGARQINLSRDLSVSGIGLAFWFIVASLFLFEGKKYLRLHLFPFSILIFYLVTYLFLVFSARIFESGLLLVLSSALLLSSWRRQCFIIAYLLLMAYLWIIQYDVVLPV